MGSGLILVVVIVTASHALIGGVIWGTVAATGSKAVSCPRRGVNPGW